MWNAIEYLLFFYVLGNNGRSSSVSPEIGIPHTRGEICDKCTRCREDIATREAATSAKPKCESNLAKAQSMF